MYTREDIKQLIPNSENVLNILYEKYGDDLKWIHYFYIDGDYEDLHITISSKGDIIYTKYYVGILLPEQATLIERRKNYEDVELEEDDIYFVNIKKDINIIADVVDIKLKQKYRENKMIL